MLGFNWFDITLIALLIVGMAVGYSQGLVRQFIGLAAIYIGLVLGTQFFNVLARWLESIFFTTPSTMINALAFFIILLGSIVIINLLAMDAYKSTRLRLVPALDHAGGMAVGLVSMWLLLTIVINVLIFATGAQAWLKGETLRLFLKAGLDGSQIVGLTSESLPMILASIRPWLPAGMPAIFKL